MSEKKVTLSEKFSLHYEEEEEENPLDFDSKVAEETNNGRTTDASVSTALEPTQTKRTTTTTTMTPIFSLNYDDENEVIAESKEDEQRNYQTKVKRTSETKQNNNTFDDSNNYFDDSLETEPDLGPVEFHELPLREIVNMVLRLRKDQKSKEFIKKQINRRSPNFTKNYPFLTGILTAENLGPTEVQQLNLLIQARENVLSGRESMQSATVRYGQSAFDLYAKK